MKSPGNRKRRRLWVVAALTAVPPFLFLAVVTYLAFGPTREDYAHRVPFEADAWRSKSLDEDQAWPTRLRMIDDLIAGKRLDELSRDEIEALLGPGDETNKWQDWSCVYYLGPERGAFRVDSEWLVIRFGADGRVKEYRRVVD